MTGCFLFAGMSQDWNPGRAMLFSGKMSILIKLSPSMRIM
jgi:hypothetical protein